MDLPFDAQQFLAVFAAYNAAVWPAQAVAYALGLLALAALFTRHPLKERTVLAVLAAMWAWNGIAYHLSFFTSINAAAFGFAALFVLQAAFFALRAFKPGDTCFHVNGAWRSIVALCLVAYALLIYELLGLIAGHGLMKGPLFGVAPCPTTIFTIALLLLGKGRSVKWLAVIPLTWAIIGTSAAILLGIPEDLGLGVAGGILALSLAISAFKRKSRTVPLT